MTELNVFDKLWFIDVRNLLDKNYYQYKANTSIFYASRKDNPTMRYIIKINKNNIEVTIPLKQNQEYTTTFTEYFKVSEFLLYHINEDLKKYGKPEVALSEAMFH